MSIFSGIKKIFRKVTKSPVGKIALGAAAAYVGGAAFGLWDSPFESLNGIFTGGGDAAASGLISGGESASDLIGGGVDALQGSSAMELGAMPGVLGSAGSAGLINAPSFASVGDVPAASSGVGQIGQAGSAAAATVPSGAGILGDVGKWIQQNPIPALIAGNMLAGAFTPNAQDIEKQRARSQMELEDWRRKYAAANTNVSGVKLGMAPSGKPLTTMTGEPVRGGLINGRI